MCLSGGKFNHLCLTVKRCSKLRNCKIDNHTNQFRKHGGACNAKICTPLSSVILSCTEILSDKRCE